MLLNNLRLPNFARKLSLDFTLQKINSFMALKDGKNYKKENKLLYLAANTLPYNSNGYATRTQAILQALKNENINVITATSCGYPYNKKDRLCETSSNITHYQGITYHHFQKPFLPFPLTHYIKKSSDVLFEFSIVNNISCIHAASNHVNALPALIAARRLNIAFQYEMRGLWELSRLSYKPSYAHSFSYVKGLALEKFVAQQADKVFVISEALKRYIVENWNIDEKKIFLLPNCVDIEAIRPDNQVNTNPLSIGYAGSLVPYEGLDTLLHAIQKVREKGLDVRLDIVGHGSSEESLKALVKELKLDNAVIFHGKKSQEEAREIISATSLVCIPRKDFEVCKIIPPIKLAEAMALGKSVILPNLPVFIDEAPPAKVESESPVFFFESNKIDSLADAIYQAFQGENSNELLIKKGLECRAHIVQSRQWKDYVLEIFHY